MYCSFYLFIIEEVHCSRYLSLPGTDALFFNYVPPGLMRPILLLPSSVNQRLPSGPAVIPNGKL